MKVIQNCTNNYIGIEQFERAKICRAHKKDQYLKNAEKYDRKYLQLEQELDALRSKKANDQSIEMQLQHLQDSLQDKINANQALIEDYKVKELMLTELKFDNGFQGNLESLTNSVFSFNC